RLGAPAVADHGHLVPARPYGDGPGVSAGRPDDRRKRPPSPALRGSGHPDPRAQTAGARERYSRPLATGGCAHARVPTHRLRLRPRLPREAAASGPGRRRRLRPADQVADLDDAAGIRAPAGAAPGPPSLLAAAVAG